MNPIFRVLESVLKLRLQLKITQSVIDLVLKDVEIAVEVFSYLRTNIDVHVAMNDLERRPKILPNNLELWFTKHHRWIAFKRIRIEDQRNYSTDKYEKIKTLQGVWHDTMFNLAEGEDGCYVIEGMAPAHDAIRSSHTYKELGREDVD